MEKNSESEEIHKVLSGERTKCLECKDGKYIKICGQYRCDKCDSFIHTTPKDVIVE